MALLHVNFFSQVLGMSVSMDVILPQKSSGIGVQSERGDSKIPVLYLLHGYSDDHTIWQRRTSIERYALEKGLAVIMPTTDLGFYTDMKYGFNYFTYFSEELPKIVHEFFPNLSTEREDTFVAGLSMGGFGAFKLGLVCPEKFAAAASLSGAVDIVPQLRQVAGSGGRNIFKLTFGTAEEEEGGINDLPAQAEKLLASDRPQPKFYQTCGTEDFLYDINISFRDRFLNRLGLTYHEEPGSHEWGYWDRNIQRVIDWLPLRSNK